MTKTSSAVRQTPEISGMPNIRLRAIAEPITSARSLAAIAILQNSQSTSETDLLKWSRQARPCRGR